MPDMLCVRRSPPRGRPRRSRQAPTHPGKPPPAQRMGGEQKVRTILYSCAYHRWHKAINWQTEMYPFHPSNEEVPTMPQSFCHQWVRQILWVKVGWEERKDSKNPQNISRCFCINREHPFHPQWFLPSLAYNLGHWQSWRLKMAHHKWAPWAAVAFTTGQIGKKFYSKSWSINNLSFFFFLLGPTHSPNHNFQ